MHCLVTRVLSWIKDYIRLAFWPVTQSMMCSWALILLDGSNKSVCKVQILFPVQVSLSHVLRVFCSGAGVQLSLAFNWTTLEAPSVSEGKWGSLLPLPRHSVPELARSFGLPWWRKDTIYHACHMILFAKVLSFMCVFYTISQESLLQVFTKVMKVNTNLHIPEDRYWYLHHSEKKPFHKHRPIHRERDALSSSLTPIYFIQRNIWLKKRWFQLFLLL